MIFNRHRRLRIISLLLLALVVRALVPAGFMPASDGSAALTLCPNGMLMPADPASGGGTHSHTEFCPFGAAPFAAPIAELPIAPALAAAIDPPGPASSPWVILPRGSRSHQARAPPDPSPVT